MSRRMHAGAFAATFVALGLGLFVLNGWHSYHPTDEGFVLAYAWRVLNGEVPYRDFLYVRTPLSPYLHTIELLLPEGWAIQSGRLIFYLELATAGALPTVWAAVRLGHAATPRALALAVTFFLFAAHHFPPMPWPTTDAVLFSSGAITATLFSLEGPARRAFALRGTASVLLALAVLAKQTFAPLAALFIAYAIVEAVGRRSWRLLVASTVPGALVAAGVLVALAAAGALSEFAHQVLAPAALRPSADVPWSGDIIAAGIGTYLGALEPFTVIFMIAAFALAGWGDLPPLAGRAAALIVVASFVVLAVLAQIDIFTTGRRLSWILVALLAGSIRSREAEGRLPTFAFGAVLAMAWCASLSFAYQTPLLGLAAAGLFVERALSRVVWPAGWVAVGLSTAAVVISMITLQLDAPYRDLPRRAQVADLGLIYPRFGQLYTNTANAERFRELRDLTVRFALAEGRGFVVVPDYPLIQYLSGTRSPLSIDWLQPQEYLGRGDRLSAELRERGPIVVIARERSPTVGPPIGQPAPCGDPPDTQPLVLEVVERWALLAEGRHFCVYGP